MSGLLGVLTDYGVEIALALSLVLGLGALAVRCSRSPVQRHRFAEWTVALALFAALLLLVPLPRLGWSEGLVAPANSTAARGDSLELDVYGLTELPSAEELASFGVESSSVPVSSPVSLELGPPEVTPPRSPVLLDTTKWLVLGFLLGSLAFALHLLFSLGLLARVLRRTGPAPAWLQRLAPEPGRARLRVSADIQRPICFGWGRGVILIPAALVEARNERRLRVVLLHECAHLDQGHGRARLVAALAAPLLYWQPLYWWLVRCARHDAELVADELAAGRMDRRDYATELIGLVESTQRTPPAAAIGLSALGSRQHFLERMETLLMRRTPLVTRDSRLQFTLRTAAALALLATVTLSWGHVPQDGGEAADVSGLAGSDGVPFLSELPTIGAFFQDREDAAPSERDSPMFANLPLLSHRFREVDDQDAVLDPPPAQQLLDFHLEFRFRRRGDLELFQRRCTEEGGHFVLLTLAEVPQGPVEGMCRVSGISKEGKQRLLDSVRPDAPGNDHPALKDYYGGKGSQHLVTNSAPLPDSGAEATRREIEYLERRLEDIDRERAQLERTLANRRAALLLLTTANDLDVTVSPEEPALQGTVLKSVANGETRVLAIDLGIRDGVQVGTIFEVYSGSTYKGRVEVTNVDDEICVGKVLLLKKFMSAGDKVTTKL